MYAVLSGLLVALFSVFMQLTPGEASCIYNGPLPDARCTPGANNTDVTQETIHSTICVRGWTSTVRPPVAETSRIKAERMIAYGVSDRSPRDFELDHLISLELGGAMDSVANLWPQEYHRADTWGAHVKDHLENTLKSDVCSGSLGLDDARSCIAQDWVSCYEHYISH